MSRLPRLQAEFGEQQLFGFGIVQPRLAPGTVPLAFNVRVSSDTPDSQPGNNVAAYSR